jgi:hypothetical protein
MNKYNMELGITHHEIMTILDGETIEFIFCNNDDLPNINVTIKEVEDDSTLSETMELSVDKTSEIV